MELNLKEGHLIYYVDDKCFGIAVDNIKQDEETKYKLAVGLFDKGVELRIIGFECIY